MSICLNVPFCIGRQKLFVGGPFRLDGPFEPEGCRYPGVLFIGLEIYDSFGLCCLAVLGLGVSR